MAMVSARDYFRTSSLPHANLRLTTIMGAESQCTVQFGKQRSEGKAQLESDHLLFRGAFRLKIPT